MARLLCSALSVVAVLLLHVGCRGPLDTSSQLSSSSILSTAAPFWQHLKVRRATYENLKGLAQLRLRTAQGRGTLDNVVVVLERFRAVRLEGIGPFGQPVFLLVSNDQRFSFYLPQERRVISGSTSTRQFAQLFGLALAPRMLPYVFVGDVPLLTLPEAGALTYLTDDDLYLWEGPDLQELWHYRIWFDPYRFLPVRFDMIASSGEVVLQVTYEDFRRLNGFTLPYRITITQPLVDHRVMWHYSDVQINMGVASALFRMRVPPGVERVELE